MKAKTSRLLFLFPFLLSLASATAQSATLAQEASQMDKLASTHGGAKVIDKISSDFSPFLGPDHAKSIVTGLRNGTTIEFPPSTPGGAPTLIDPPTGKMGFGNVYISLALAQQRAAQLGLSQPVTPEQLQALLVGGPITTPGGATTTEGILALRSQNMGWGQIAQKYGFKLGSVVSAMRSANKGVAVTTSPASAGATTGAPGRGSAPESGIVTGSGRALGKAGAASGTGASGEGIVTGSGRPAGSSPGLVGGRGHAYGLDRSGPAAGGHGKGHGK